MSQVKENDTVKVHYTGKLTNGEVFDSSLEREPLEFTLGQGQLIPGFEKGMINMELNEKKTLNIPCAEAYGERREEMMQEVPKNQLPPEVKPEVGMGLISQTPDGQEMRLTVAEVKDETIVVDANHPLAGQDLVFDIELLEIK
ncbi:FKBP-type peptidyl-prolyl cis-trans isomerase [Owenweeksia hongkongensis]|uniref:Peptidyl-prolyl cis-trans isomerase n=1 Tax=Owenweeksia hongkongensis (strain DSM 17368 / CIP 108786 / JCM 12287 / NRRL B-23963 / UST20020801) TaxID=926562 RepID=G8R0D4_OWEHD|nr:peptidylprolyl isomerase [Owenweeksia hongkongensis]AEV31594.1 FKBP-type peptidyl-prolyl cis-trans isomerase [Owenweeksia hongkongensis DSM 17368]